jgi:hypothetical protein
MAQVSVEEVQQIRSRIKGAHERANSQFRNAFATRPLPPEAYLEILANELLADAEGVRVTGRPYDLVNGLITPIHASFDVDREPAAIFEYWLLISEITGSTSWRMTRVIATAEEYDAALRMMSSPQIVRALIASFLPAVDVERGMLEVTVYTRAQEERVERRTLALDASNEFHFHGRELIAEGRGGVKGA